MRINITDKDNAGIIEDTLFRTLKKVYIGEGLWLDLNEIKLDFSEDTDDPLIVINVKYGRYVEGGNNNFQSEITFYCDDTEVDLQFLCGYFFCHLNEEDIKYKKD